MTLNECNYAAMGPAMIILGPKFDTPAARAMLLSIALQESNLEHRLQVGGPARGFWQFEKGGGVRGVLNHPASRDHAKRLCAARNVRPDEQDVYWTVALDDVLAAGFARLLLWTDPSPLPGAADADAAWKYYQRNWRPGKPHPEKWPALYRRAWDFIGSAK